MSSPGMSREADGAETSTSTDGIDPSTSTEGTSTSGVCDWEDTTNDDVKHSNLAWLGTSHLHYGSNVTTDVRM